MRRWSMAVLHLSVSRIFLFLLAMALAARAANILAVDLNDDVWVLYRSKFLTDIVLHS